MLYDTTTISDFILMSNVRHNLRILYLFLNDFSLNVFDRCFVFYFLGCKLIFWMYTRGNLYLYYYNKF